MNLISVGISCIKRAPQPPEGSSSSQSSSPSESLLLPELLSTSPEAVLLYNAIEMKVIAVNNAMIPITIMSFLLLPCCLDSAVINNTNNLFLNI